MPKHYLYLCIFYLHAIFAGWKTYRLSFNYYILTRAPVWSKSAYHLTNTFSYGFFFVLSRNILLAYISTIIHRKLYFICIVQNYSHIHTHLGVLFCQTDNISNLKFSSQMNAAFLLCKVLSQKLKNAGMPTVKTVSNLRGTYSYKTDVISNL